MKYYDRSDESLIPDDFEDNHPFQDFVEEDESDDENGDNRNFDNDSDDNDSHDNDSDDNESDDNDGANLMTPQADNSKSNENDSEISDDDDDGDEESSSDEEDDDFDNDGQVEEQEEENRQDEEDDNSDFIENDENLEDENELKRVTDYSSSSSSYDSSGSEYAPLRPKFASRKTGASRDPSQPSSSGLVGTNRDLRFRDESDESDGLQTSQVHKKKNTKPPHKLTPPSKKYTDRKKTKDDISVSPVSADLRSPLAPAQILRGTSLASKRRTLRGKGRKEGMLFSARVRQQFQERKTRPTTRGRGSRGGKIAHQLLREREQNAALHEDQENETQLRMQKPSRSRKVAKKPKEATQTTRTPQLRRNPPRGQKSTNKKQRGGKQNRG